ncbi:hypothetical protein GUITHDRAFT_105008 [Guillardia theta CCMP2712]|uniref:Uncharacterized protein n=1 Tax=Guillardia theta (strain CCMP2712) TaxID=905079 RepID=L1JMQ6_GUITC|nr:hypothetical protein GUITHDRAFT_105008 [Guillardia theta CCMP2712]EKX49480.1 hypothetical protein GUITHDRAFT_105008 [Guillardia theta CCMP2712]|eukprot:XP_005836460.1 hypothetical protein GUITHDRAFT_105008 [Guillardia theta CCMP2712]
MFMIILSYDVPSGQTRRARKAVDSPSLKAHMDVIKPSDQTAPGRLQSEMDQVFTKSFARIGVQDRPREDFFGPSTVLEKSSMKRPSSSQSQRSKARLDFEKQSTMFREENGVNGILAGKWLKDMIV